MRRWPSCVVHPGDGRYRVVSSRHWSEKVALTEYFKANHRRRVPYLRGSGESTGGLAPLTTSSPATAMMIIATKKVREKIVLKGKPFFFNNWHSSSPYLLSSLSLALTFPSLIIFSLFFVHFPSALMCPASVASLCQAGEGSSAPTRQLANWRLIKAKAWSIKKLILMKALNGTVKVGGNLPTASSFPGWGDESLLGGKLREYGEGEAIVLVWYCLAGCVLWRR